MISRRISIDRLIMLTRVFKDILINYIYINLESLLHSQWGCDASWIQLAANKQINQNKYNEINNRQSTTNWYYLNVMQTGWQCLAL